MCRSTGSFKTEKELTKTESVDEIKHETQWNVVASLCSLDSHGQGSEQFLLVGLESNVLAGVPDLLTSLGPTATDTAGLEGIVEATVVL